MKTLFRAVVLSATLAAAVVLAPAAGASVPAPSAHRAGYCLSADGSLKYFAAAAARSDASNKVGLWRAAVAETNKHRNTGDVGRYFKAAWARLNTARDAIKKQNSTYADYNAWVKKQGPGGCTNLGPLPPKVPGV